MLRESALSGFSQHFNNFRCVNPISDEILETEFWFRISVFNFFTFSRGDTSEIMLEARSSASRFAKFSRGDTSDIALKARSNNKRESPLRRYSPRTTKTEAVVRKRGRRVVAVGGPHDRSKRAPGAAAQHAFSINLCIVI